MDIKQLIQIAAILAGLALSSRHLPEILHMVQIAQLQLIKASQTSSWGQSLFPTAEK
jgi:hypothetical protein